MSMEDLVYECSKLVAVWECFDELPSMRIHNEKNCEAFVKEIKFRVNRIHELCEEERD